MGALHVVGVRHHSPACARVVQAVLERVQPAVVLVEGPSDYNPRLAQLGLAHKPPVAIFTHYLTKDGPHACYTPLCEWSPEWVALRWALAHGVTARFADLPAWDKAFLGVEHRYGEHDAHYERSLAALCRATGCSDQDALWEHLFEGRSAEENEAALQRYFFELRGSLPADARDGPREEHMRAWASWALREARGGAVLFVCGGWHAPALESVREGGEEPRAEPSTFGGESHLIPWSHSRMDSFTGYQSGMPSSAWWAAQWRAGPERCFEELFERILSALRKTQTARPTVADHIAARAQVLALASLRGHPVPQRVDVLDGLLAALVREPLSGPPPWTRRGAVRGSLHPVVATMLRVLTGEELGALDQETERPALVHEVLAELAAKGFALEPQARTYSLDWRLEEDRPRLRLLHRSRTLELPGFERVQGPSRGTDPQLTEAWKLTWRSGLEPALIEASRWGSTLEAAVTFRLAQQMLEAEGVDAVAAVLHRAAFVGLDRLSAQLVAHLEQAFGQCALLAPLGRSLPPLLLLWRHGEWLCMEGAPLLAPLLRAGAERTLTLLGELQGPELLPQDLEAVRALREVLRHRASLGLEEDALFAALHRRRVDETAPPMLRGAALGLLWSLLERSPALSSALREDLSEPRKEQELGAWLAGLFALARQPALEEDALVGVVDEVVQALPDERFLSVLPALRFAFSWFPPRERRRVGELLALRWGGGSDGRWVEEAPSAELLRGLQWDERAEALGQKWGLLR